MKNSQRNRHTGLVNAFKADIIKRGRTVKTRGGRVYKVAICGGSAFKRGNNVVVRLTK